MKNCSSIHVQAQVGAKLVMKKPEPVSVRFAQEAGTVETLEGVVSYIQDDAILTSKQCESWTVQRERFLCTYSPIPPYTAGEDGIYSKLPISVWALQMDEPFFIILHNGSRLDGKPFDWLVQYSQNECGIVQADIFEQTYLLVEE